MSNALGTLNLAAVEDALYDWAYNIAKGGLNKDVQVFWKDQGEQLPARPCVALKFIYGPAPTDRDPNVFLGTVSGPTTFGMQQEGILSVQVFGNTQVCKPLAHQLALDLNSSLMLQSVRDKLKQGGVSIQGLGKVQLMSALEESKYEERAGFEVELGLVQNISETVGTIETVNIQGKVDGESIPTQTVVLP